MISDLMHPFVTSILGDIISAEDYELVIPPAGQSGDISIACFPFTKILGDNPVSIAQKLTDGLSKESNIQEAIAVGPFVNISFSDALLMRMIGDFRIREHTKKDEVVIVDYIGTNIGKPMHIGHICTPTYGQPIIEIFRYFGYTVIGDVHQGDWGAVFGKLIHSWKQYGNKSEFNNAPVEYLLELYVKINEDISNDPTIEELCREEFRLLSQGDPGNVELWNMFTKASLKSVGTTLKKMKIQYDHAIGESFYEGINLPKITDHPDLTEDVRMSYIVEELIEKGIAVKNEDGSVGVTFPKETKIPSTILQKKNGTHGYLASDLATLKYRQKNWEPDINVVCTGSEQRLHFQQVYWIAQHAGWGLENAQLVHAMNGLVKLPDGKFSTRTRGRFISLDSLIEEANVHAKKILEEKKRKLSSDDVEAISIGAIKYTFLAQDRSKDIVFTWEKALSFEGNSGPYVQYAIVRTKKLLEQFEDIKEEPVKVCELTEYDKKLVMDLMFFENQLEKARKMFKFHALVNFCYEVANHINQFYTNTDRLIDEENRDLQVLRVQLLRKTLLLLESSFEILALPIPTKM